MPVTLILHWKRLNKKQGSNLVGTSTDLTLARRAHLAVVAHIRHVHTNYDNILKQTTWTNARIQVEAATLDKIIEWRGKDDCDKDLEEVDFREVLIIPDDDEDEESDVEEIIDLDEPDKEPPIRDCDVHRTGFAINPAAEIHTAPLNLSNLAAMTDLEEAVIAPYRQLRVNPLLRQRLSADGRAKTRALRQKRWQDALRRSRAEPHQVATDLPGQTEVVEIANENPLNQMVTRKARILGSKMVSNAAISPIHGSTSRHEPEVSRRSMW